MLRIIINVAELIGWIWFVEVNGIQSALSMILILTSIEASRGVK